MQRDNADILGQFGKGLLRKALRTHNLVLCQVVGWRMQYSQCGNVWRNREGLDSTLECLVNNSGGAVGRRDCQIIM